MKNSKTRPSSDAAILFDFDKSNLRPEAQANLKSLAESLKAYPNTEVVVVGHTDDRGAEDYNQRLSERRADVAGRFLIDLNVAPERITTFGKGEMEPKDTNQTEAGRQTNRRVEVAIYATDEYRQQLDNQN